MTACAGKGQNKMCGIGGLRRKLRTHTPIHLSPIFISLPKFGSYLDYFDTLSYSQKSRASAVRRGMIVFMLHILVISRSTSLCSAFFFGFFVKFPYFGITIFINKTLFFCLSIISSCLLVVISLSA